MNKLNSAVHELLESVPQPRPDPDPEPVAFSFNMAKDEVGLPLESPAYVKYNCKLCYGRGYLVFLVGNGYREEGGQQVAMRSRNARACVCVHKGYERARLTLQRAEEAAAKAEGPSGA